MKGQNRFSSEELAGFCNQIAIILKSGISLYDGIYILKEEVEDKKTKHVLLCIEDKLKQNESFHNAMKETNAFPGYLLSMVNIGEHTGKLETVMNSMAYYYQREADMKDSIRNVIAYPMLMFAMIAIILLVLVGKILPMFQRVFENLSVDVASSSTKFMNFGVWAGKIVAIVSLVVLVVGIGLILWYRTKKGEEILNKFSCNFFVTKKTSHLLAVGKFISSMSVMISSGMDQEEALELAQEANHHPQIKENIKQCRQLVKDNKSLAEAMKEEKLITGMQGRIVSLAAKSGMLEDVLGDISSQYDESISEQLTHMCNKLEITLVISLSLIIGCVLLSIMFPLISIISAIG
ncbi:MAG: type II secretion system F family protein [Lachnospiraceae bacterium]|nr:type II secretion system F family protein [Lachnospiraceae bacterium]